VAKEKSCDVAMQKERENMILEIASKNMGGNSLFSQITNGVLNQRVAVIPCRFHTHIHY
jgi:hypothetical protein